jgi:hypothetical protein
MNKQIVEAYMAEWAPVQWQLPTTPNRQFYKNWELFIEVMTGIKNLDSLTDLDRYSIGNTVSIIIRTRTGITVPVPPTHMIIP